MLAGESLKTRRVICQQRFTLTAFESRLEEVGAFRERAKRKDMHVAAWKLFTSRIFNFKGDSGSATNTMDSDVCCFDLKVSALSQLPHFVRYLAIGPTRTGGVPGKVEQIFIKGVLLHVHGDNSVRQVTENG